MSEQIGFKLGHWYRYCYRCGTESMGQGDYSSPPCGCPPHEPTMEVTAVDTENGIITIAPIKVTV